MPGKTRIADVTGFAILSHTWLHSLPGEITYDDWHQGDLDATHPGYRKLVNFCNIAAEKHGLSLAWMDTVCINKSSSSELDESIRSMYMWYQSANVCLTYLAETVSLVELSKDPWFTRGWTLQELLAPDVLKFYNRDWKQLTQCENDKEDKTILQKIQEATTIWEEELLEDYEVPISRKMQWAADRNVTREEDTAYSLMGIFGVSIPIAYGEGRELAFVRLIKEILNISKNDVLDIFNWAGNYDTRTSALLPSSPKAY
ncbi:hypothetical protein BDN70DRAFT_819364, partial [Pholiota conissans]